MRGPRKHTGLRLAVVVLLAVPLLVAAAAPARASDPAPAAPAITSVTPGDGTLTVAFVAPAGCSACTVVVEASETASPTSSADILASASGTTSPLTLTGLTNGTAYHVRAYVRVMSGGTVTEFVGDGTIGGNGIRYRVHTFTTVGSSTLTVDRDVDVEVLVVGGGGAGGRSAGGGGGSGGFVEASTTVPAGDVTVTVGAGGTPSGGDVPAADGADSSVAGVVALGGGGGMSMTGPSQGITGRDGGSGGGGTRDVDSGTSATPGTAGGDGLQPGSSSGGFGSAGAAGIGVSGGNTQGGGGGGAGGPGLIATEVDTDRAGDGGPGRASTITGASIVYAGGGGGGVGGDYTRAGNGGTGGGGDGAFSVGGSLTLGFPGTDGLGGGGGGGSALPGQSEFGGAGGSGIVIVRHIVNVGVHPVAVTPGTPVAEPLERPHSTLAVGCEPAPLVAGSSVTCTVTGADPDVDLLWQLAADGDVFLEGDVRIGSDGRGELTAVVPRTTLGRSVSIELVAWTGPVPLGTVGAEVPMMVPAGGGPTTRVARWSVLAAAIATLLAVRAALRPPTASAVRLRWNG